MYPSGFTRLFAKIATSRCDVTLLDLARLLELPSDQGTLAHVARIAEVLNENGVMSIPPLTKGELDTVRTLVFEVESTSTHLAELQRDLNALESSKIEFKSSLRFDIDRFNKQVDADAKNCHSDEVLFSALKTIAAFANSDGGVLYIGIADSSKICGLWWDFKISSTSDEDKWQLYLRDAIETKFCDGKLVNDYVFVNFLTPQADTLARVDVKPRASLTFLKKNGQFLLYRRQGNRTLQVEFADIEEFLKNRWGTGTGVLN